MIDQFVVPVLLTFSSALITWLFARRKNKADAVSIEKTNDRSEIENYQFIAKEWREAAEQWKRLADEYQISLIENSRKFEALSKEFSIHRGLLTRANNRIRELEKHQ